MNKDEILRAINKGEATLRGTVRTGDDKQLDAWQLNGKDYLITGIKVLELQERKPAVQRRYGN